MEKELDNKNIICSTEVSDQPGSSTALPSGRSLLRYKYYFPFNCGDILDENLNMLELESELYKEYSRYRKQFNINNPFDTIYLIKNFPAAKNLIIRNLKVELENDERCLIYADELRKKYEDIIYRKSQKEDEDYWRDVVEYCFLYDLTHDKTTRTKSNPFGIKREDRIKKNKMYLSMLKGKSSTSNPVGVTPLEISNAKAFPITNLIDFKRRVATCPFHSEKTPSLYHYPTTNTCHCFGACSKSFDSIEIFRRLNNCSFVEAVRKLQ